MGILRFQLPEQEIEGMVAALDRLRFVAGYDRTPFPTSIHRDGCNLAVSHDLEESGFISVPWPIPGFGFPVTISATLRERGAPYRLLTELARGKLNQVRNMLEDWKHSGLDIPEGLGRRLQETTSRFAHAAIDETAAADGEAAQALEAAYGIAFDLSKNFLECSARLQRTRLGRPATRTTCRIRHLPRPEEAEHYLQTFEVIYYAPNWNEIEPEPARYNWSSFDAVVEWAVQTGRPLIVGPLIDLGGDDLPGWLNLDEVDLSTLAAYFCDYVETAIARYRDKIRDWLLCTGFNHADLFGINQEDRLRLVVRMLESARGVDPEGRWVIGVSQPWGEYLEQAKMTISPLVFCDTLLRTGLQIAGFCLEIFAGETNRRASLLRDPFELLRLLELYALLNVPLDIVASHPGSSLIGCQAAECSNFSTCYRASCSAESQAEWGSLIAGLVNTQSHIRCFSWDHWIDGPQAQGLLTPTGQPKPLLDRLRQIRHEFTA